MRFVVRHCLLVCLPSVYLTPSPMMKSPRPSPSIFAYWKGSNTEDLGMSLSNSYLFVYTALYRDYTSLFHTVPWLYPTLPHSTPTYRDSTSFYYTQSRLYPTLPHCTLARADSTSLYHTLPWLHLTLPHSTILYPGSTRLPHSTILYPVSPCLLYTSPSPRD